MNLQLYPTFGLAFPSSRVGLFMNGDSVSVESPPNQSWSQDRKSMPTAWATTCSIDMIGATVLVSHSFDVLLKEKTRQT